MSTKIKAISKLKIKATKAKAVVAKKKAVALDKAKKDKTACFNKCRNRPRGSNRHYCERDCVEIFNNKKAEIKGKYVDHPVYGRLRY